MDGRAQKTCMRLGILAFLFQFRFAPFPWFNKAIGEMAGLEARREEFRDGEGEVGC